MMIGMYWLGFVLIPSGCEVYYLILSYACYFFCSLIIFYYPSSSTMLSALSKSRTPESHTRALEILDSMSANHVTPNAFHYAAVMNMYVHSNSTDRESVVMGLFDRYVS